MNVVDQDDVAPRGTRFGIGGQRERSGDDPLTLAPPLAAQRCSRFDAVQQVMVARRAGGARQFIGDQRGLVETARP